ncbi:MAG: glycosyltransferase family 2 protein, partial [Planctomycetia bacterium]
MEPTLAAPVVATERLLSLVVPVYNEADSLRTLLEEISAVAADLDDAVEVVFVDDGSTDGSWEVIRTLNLEDPRVTGVKFRRNFGKAAALAAGFAQAQGRRVFTLDADLQDDPREIPRFLAKMDEGYDVVSGWKKLRHDPWHKTLPSAVFNRMVGWLTGVKLHDHNCGFKGYNREVLGEIQLYGEFHRFIPVLAHSRGFKVGEIVVNHRARRHGVSKYGWERFIKGFIDLATVYFLTAYRNRPQHLLGSAGLLCVAVGMTGMAYLSQLWIRNQFGADFGPIGDRPLLIFSATAVVLGAQLSTIGLLAELITARDHDAGRGYSVADRRPA